MKHLFNYLGTVLLVLFLYSFSYSQNTYFDMTLELSSNVREINSSLTEVQVCWRTTLPSATFQQGLRKAQGQLYWNKSFTLSNADTCFLDTIPTNSIYEYCVRKDTSIFGIPVFGYVSSGIVKTATLDRGNVILIVDTTYLGFNNESLRTFEKCLIGDGWQYDKFRVDSGTSISTIKAGIVSRYNANPTRVNTVILLGDIKVPYSGGFNSLNVSPDGHTPQHDGAWPADVYYGDIQSSSWTDTSINITTGTRSENNNIPGDGKFDQSTIPTLTELIVGRIDLSDMPASSYNDSTLLTRYIVKNKNYRYGIVNNRGRAIVDDNLGLLGGEAFAGTNCYRNMSSLIGRDSVNFTDYITGLNAGSYKWAFGYGFGSYTNATGIGSTASLLTNSNNLKGIFNVFMGSYFPDWDNSNNFLRAPLVANGTFLTSVAGGRPNLFFHSMSMGKSIGYSVWQSINNYNTSSPGDLYSSYHYGSRFIHTALMGDPTLRLNYVKMPYDISFCKDSAKSDTMQIFWRPPLNEYGVDSFYVFRGESELDSFIYLGSTVDTTYKDTIYDVNKEYYYMVKSSKMDTTGGGYYRNLSQGLCAMTDYIDKIPYHDSVYFCIGDSIEVGRDVSIDELTENYTYTWNNNTYLSDTLTYKSFASPIGSIQYILETKDKFGFTSFDTIDVFLVAEPSTGIGVISQSISCGDSLTVSSSPTPTSSLPFTWTFENGIPNSVSGNNSVGPHSVVFNQVGTNKVNLNIQYNNNTCLYKDSINVAVNCLTLPVTLGNFGAVLDQNKVLVSWSTFSEMDNKEFEIWRSDKNGVFKRVGVEKSKSNNGNSSSRLDYLFIDKNLPSSEILFYKLRQLDYNGNYEESKISIVILNKEEKIFPNPFKSTLNINYKGVDKLSIYTIDGSFIEELAVVNGIINLEHLNSGCYLIKLLVEDIPYTKYLIKK